MTSTKAPSRRRASARPGSSVVPAGDEARTSTIAPPRKRAAGKRALRLVADRDPIGDDPFGEALTAGFRNAAEAAVQQALNSGLAVPGRENGKPVERRPDGKVVEIDDRTGWSPDSWTSRP